jgi:nicotinamide-nucleotide amidase
MDAAILAVGSELLGTDRLDTNSLKLTALLERYGVRLIEKGVVGDDEAAIARRVRELVDRVGLVLVTGGLGPTADDVTREATADALGRTLDLDPAALATLEARYRSFNRRMPEVNRRQAYVPGGATLLVNPRGTAPGLRLTAENGSTVFLFPGVPLELEGMMRSDLAPWLAERAGGEARETVSLKVACVPESELEERIAPAYAEFGREHISVLARPGEVMVRATAGGPETARRARLAAMADRLAELIGPEVFTRDGERTLEAVVVDLLAEAGETLALAESCTGGLIAERVTRVPGSSAVFPGGVVSYSNAIKTALLGVPAELLIEHGAVSEPVARAMAAGVRSRLGADWGVAVTGIAGPGGGTPEKTVGLVHLAWARPDDTVDHGTFRFPGLREQNRELASQVALEGLRRRLLGRAEAGR